MVVSLTEKEGDAREGDDRRKSPLVFVAISNIGITLLNA
jgi:hypothetical protein